MFNLKTHRPTQHSFTHLFPFVISCIYCSNVQQQDPVIGPFTNNNNNIGLGINLSSYLPPLQPPSAPQHNFQTLVPFPAPVGQGPSPVVTIGGAIDNSIFGTFRSAGQLQQYQNQTTTVITSSSSNTQPQQAIAAHFFDGQTFVPVQVYVEGET